MNVTTMPLVSIALCTYNGEKHLREQLNSLVNQSYPNIEIIAIDDCSSDRTVAILNSFKNSYPFISIQINQENLGYVRNFEKAISHCKGEFIALCDQDDIWSLNKIKAQIEDIGEYSVSYHDSLLIDDAGEPVQKSISSIFNLYEGKHPLPFLFFNCVSGHSLMFHRRILRFILPFSPGHFHDWWIAIIGSEHGGVKLTPGHLVKYRQHSTSATDLLGAKKNEHVAEIFFTKKRLSWIMLFAGRSKHYQAYCKSLISCFDKDGQLINRRKLFCLVALNYKKLFFMIKKSNWSKLNFVRKICLQPKYSTIMNINSESTGQ